MRRSRKEEEERLRQVAKIKTELDRHRKLQSIQAARGILPEEALNTAQQEKLSQQFTDPWSKILSEIKRQLDGSGDLRVLIADDNAFIPQEKDHRNVRFFKGLLSEWQFRLFSLSNEELANRRPDLEEMWQTLFALQPLFEGFNERTLSSEITNGVNAIVDSLQKSDYQSADAAYFELAVGKSLWPIGITQFSIHWKFSVDLMDSEKVLHIFNSETGRNAITSVRKMMNKYKEFHAHQ